MARHQPVVKNLNKKIITINQEYELYLRINNILTVQGGLSNVKYYGILNFCTSPKVN